MENTYRFYILNKAGEYLFSSGGLVGSTTTKTHLQYAPKNWSDIVLSWERGFKYHGIVRKTSTTLEFNKDIAFILRSLYYQNGVNAYAKFVIEKFNNTLAVQNYELFYEGEINFVSFKSSHFFVSAEIIEGGFLSKLESRSDTNYEIDLYSNPNQIWVKMDGINLQEICYYTHVGAGFTITGTPFDWYVPFKVYSREGVITSTYLEPNATIPIKSVVKNSTSNTTIYTIKLNGSIIIFLGGSLGMPKWFNIIIRERDSTGTVTGSFTSIFTSTALLVNGINVTIPFNINTSYSLPSGHSLDIVCILLDNANPTLGVGSLNTFWDLVGGNTHLDILADNRTPTTYIKCLRPIQVFSDLIDKISDSETIADSGILDSNEDLVITSFDSIRNLENSKLKTNFNDFYKSYDSKLGLSFQYDKENNIALIEEKANVYDDSSVVIDLGDISEFETNPLSDGLFSKLLVGQNPQTYDEVNGKDEFNTENEFLSPLTAVSTESNMKSIYRSDMYGIELTRLNLTNKKVTDGESDNDVAMLHIGSTIAGTIPSGFAGAGEDYYELYRDSGLTITNIYSPQTAYNIKLSPLRCILRNGNYIRSLLYGNDTEYIKYQTSSKSNFTGLKMVTDDGTTILDEGANILISDLNDIIFKPTIFQFKTRIPLSIESIMNNTPYKLYSFTYKRNTFYGFVLKVSTQPAFKNAQTFTLLCAPSTDLNNLIY